jgi:ribosomal protein S18 acetylase RimI-like enzyme
MTRSIHDVQIRDARGEDRPVAAALTLQAYGEYAAKMAPEAWAGLEGAVRAALALEDASVERIVAARGGEIVGSVMLYPPAADAYGGLTDAASWPELRLVAVAPSARGHGVGRALVEECVRRARAAGAAALGLHTSRTMEIAMGMYERMGFIRDPEHDFQPPGAELVTAYRLPL